MVEYVRIENFRHRMNPNTNANANKPPTREMLEAFRILSRYERTLIEKMACEVVDRREDFENPFMGSEQIIDKYFNLLMNLGRLRAGLYAYFPREEKQNGVKEIKAGLKETAAKDEFRCQLCHGVIRPGAGACPQCGWMWGQRG